MDLGISGKSAIVCGASSGIGRAVAFELGKEGARVLICSRHEERIKEVALELNPEFAKGRSFPARQTCQRRRMSRHSSGRQATSSAESIFSSQTLQAQGLVGSWRYRMKTGTTRST